MNKMRVVCEEMFDGARWCGPTTIEVAEGLVTSVEPIGSPLGFISEGDTWNSDPASSGSRKHLSAKTVLPGLVDSAISASGYAEVPSSADPYQPERAYARMCLRYGITTIVDVNNSQGALSYLQTLGESGQGPALIHSAGRIASVATGRHDIVVKPEAVESVIDAQVAAGATLVSVGQAVPATLERVLEAAAGLGLPVIVARQTAPETPGFECIMPAVNGGTYEIPQLHASLHWTVDGLLEAPDAHLASPVLPHCRHFTRSRGRIGRRIAQPIVGRYYADRNPSLLDPDLENMVGKALRAGRCVASSGGGSTGMVPGMSLWYELDRFYGMASNTEAFGAATLVAAECVNHSDAPPPPFGSIRPGGRADLLLSTGDGHGLPSTFLDGMSVVVLAGVLHDVGELAKEVETLVAEATKGSP